MHINPKIQSLTSYLSGICLCLIFYDMGKLSSLPFKVSELGDVHEIKIEAKPRKDWEQWILLTSDRHWDNPKSDRRLQTKHLQLAKERNALIIDNGDLLCLMQGKYDPRGSKSSIRPEHNVDHYLDAVIDDAANYFAPYGENFAFLVVGNHEASVSKRCETNISRRFADALKLKCPGSPIHVGGIAGFIRLNFSMPNTQSYLYTIDYHHGYGGGGPVTKGVIQANRRAVYSEADICIQGHTHEAWQFPIQRRKVTQQGKITHPIQWHLQIPSYKRHFAGGKPNWENLKGFPPKPVGCLWLRFFYHRERKRDNVTSRLISFERQHDLVEFGA